MYICMYMAVLYISLQVINILGPVEPRVVRQKAASVSPQPLPS